MDGFERLSESNLRKFSAADMVELNSNGYIRTSKVTRAPYFIVDHILTLSDDVKSAGGCWWIDIDGSRTSLMDWNVVPNKYNDHSIKVLTNR